MEPKYAHHTIQDLWSRHSTLAYWAEVEKAVARVQADAGLIPADAADAIGRAGPPSAAMIDAAEARTKHDVAAFIESFSQHVPVAYRSWVHHGMTSSDLVDTANAIRLTSVTDAIRLEAYGLSRALDQLRSNHVNTWRTGRTHGQAAEPIQFGRQLLRLRARLTRADHFLADNPVPMKLSGAVGNYTYNPPQIEDVLTQEWGLAADGYASQVVARDYYATWAFGLVQLATAVEAIATEIRISAQTEIDEIREAFGPEQVGSTAMPHKRNPIRSERLVGLARVARSYLYPLLETEGGLWSERDISNSSVERICLKDLSCLVGWMLHEATDLVSGLQVDTEQMAANLRQNLPLPTPAARLWLGVRHGADRASAYNVAQQSQAVAGSMESAVDEKAWAEIDAAAEIEWYGRNL